MTALYTIAQAAQLTDRHPGLIRRLCTEHKLTLDEASKPGRDWLLTEAGLARLQSWPHVGWRKGKSRKG